MHLAEPGRTRRRRTVATLVIGSAGVTRSALRNLLWTPRIFANAVSSCGFGYPRPGLARTARPLTYPSRSLPKRELGLSPPRSHPRFGPSCERIGVPTYETNRATSRTTRAPVFARQRPWFRIGFGAIWLTALARAYRRVAQSRICTTVYTLAQQFKNSVVGLGELAPG
jgi:hypothetical protein